MSEHVHRIDWLARQMYSRTRPIGRDQIFAGFEAVLVELAASPAGPAQLVTSVENAGAEFLGYSAPQETFRIVAGSLALTCTIDPILASMGVSGEDHGWTAEGLPTGVELRGSAHSSARSPSYAELRVAGVSDERFSVLRERFAAAFPAVMSEAELVAELGPR